MEDFQNFGENYEKFQIQYSGLKLSLALKAFHVCHGEKAETIEEVSAHIASGCSACEE